jgi:hypothetical protein
MNSILVSQTPHSLVFSRNGAFLTSIPIRRRFAVIHPNGRKTWAALNPKPGEPGFLIRRLALAVNSNRSGSLFDKIHETMNIPYTSTRRITKSVETRKEDRERPRKPRGARLCSCAGTRSSEPGSGRELRGTSAVCPSL